MESLKSSQIWDAGHRQMDNRQSTLPNSVQEGRSWWNLVDYLPHFKEMTMGTFQIYYVLNLPCTEFLGQQLNKGWHPPPPN